MALDTRVLRWASSPGSFSDLCGGDFNSGVGSDPGQGE
ncbi:hypothetical protein Pmani_011636, partial [Petrolisthes manimaculis]